MTHLLLLHLVLTYSLTPMYLVLHRDYPAVGRQSDGGGHEHIVPEVRLEEQQPLLLHRLPAPLCDDHADPARGQPPQPQEDEPGQGHGE